MKGFLLVAGIFHLLWRRLGEPEVVGDTFLLFCSPGGSAARTGTTHLDAGQWHAQHPDPGWARTWQTPACSCHWPKAPNFIQVVKSLKQKTIQSVCYCLSAAFNRHSDNQGSEMISAPAGHSSRVGGNWKMRTSVLSRPNSLFSTGVFVPLQVCPSFRFLNVYSTLPFVHVTRTGIPTRLTLSVTQWEELSQEL